MRDFIAGIARALSGGIANQWNLAAFGLAVVIYALSKRRGHVTTGAWVTIVILVLGPIVSLTYSEYRKHNSVYSVRVVVVGREGVPVTNAEVYSSAGGEMKRLAEGVEFQIPVAAVPGSREITIYASLKHAFLHGSSRLVLGDERVVSALVKLERDVSAIIRGIVLDPDGRAVSGAMVSVVGYASDAVTTGPGGHFELPAHAATGQHVQLHVERSGRSVNQWHLAGLDPATITLPRRR